MDSQQYTIGQLVVIDDEVYTVVAIGSYHQYQVEDSRGNHFWAKNSEIVALDNEERCTSCHQPFQDARRCTDPDTGKATLCYGCYVSMDD